MKRSRLSVRERRAIAVIAITAVAISIGAAASRAAGQGVMRELSNTGEGWVATDSSEAGGGASTASTELNAARRALAEGRYSEADRLAEEWIDRYVVPNIRKAPPGETDMADEYPDLGLAPEAFLVRGDAMYLAHEEYKALYHYEVIARHYPDSEAFVTALEREFEIATVYAGGLKRKMWGFRWTSAYDEAQELFVRIQERVPGSRLAEKAGRALADLYYNRKQMDLAVIAYDLYLENHRDAPDRADAMRRLIHANLSTFKGPAFDTRGLADAREWLGSMEAAFPAESQQIGTDALRARIDESDAQHMLLNARWYLDRRDPVSARFVLRRLVRRYPTTVAGGEAYDLMAANKWIAAEEGVPTEPASDEAPTGITPEETESGAGPAAASPQASPDAAHEESSDRQTLGDVQPYWTGQGTLVGAVRIVAVGTVGEDSRHGGFARPTCEAWRIGA